MQTEPTLTIAWGTRPAALQPRAILEYELTSGYAIATDEFSITFYDEDPRRLQNLALEPVELSVHGASQLIGRIERVERGGDGNAVTVRGRDFISELEEGHIDPTAKVTEDMKLGDVFLYLAGPYGISTVIGDKDATLRNIRTGVVLGKSSDPSFESFKPGDLKPEPGTGLLEYLNQIAARHGYTIQPGPDRSTLVLAKPFYDQPALNELFRSRDPQAARRNNIIDANSSEDYSMFPTVGLSSGKVAVAGESPTTVSTQHELISRFDALGATFTAAVDGKIDTTRRLPKNGVGDASKLYRLWYLKDEKSRTPEQVEAAIIRAVSERLKDTLNYQATVLGHRDAKSGAVWAVDTIVKVTDEVCDIAEDLWIAERTLSYSQGGGSTTSLRCWRKGAFQV